MATTLLAEVKKIVEPCKADAVYIGNSAYISLGDIKIRVDIVTMGIADCHEAMQIKCMNAKNAEIDTIRVRFKELLKKNIRLDKEYRSNAYAWYFSEITASDYKKLTEELNKYISVFC